MGAGPPDRPREDAMERLEATIQRVTYRNEDNLFSVVRLKVDGAKGEVTATGKFPTAKAGQLVVLTGEWTVHPTYGRQLSVSEVEYTEPKTKKGIEKYLASGVIPGIGPSKAKAIVEFFGADALEILDRNPERLTEIKGFGEKMASKIAKGLQEHKAVEKIMVFLRGHGATQSDAIKIYKAYGDRAISAIKENPYRLAAEIRGIGFKKADAIAYELGFKANHPYRVMSGISHFLMVDSEEGHCYSDLEEFSIRVAAQLGVEENEVRKAAAGMDGGEVVLEDGHRLFWAPLWHGEKGVAKLISKIADTGMWRLEEPKDEEIEEVQAQSGVELASAQIKAVKAAMSNGVSILTGGPGTGKTTTIRTMIALFEKKGKKVLLAAPTGRAAKRMSEATGKPAMTIHRLLEFQPRDDGWRFERDEDNPLKCDALIIDEVSMVDVMLMYSLLKAVKPGTRLVLVGDVDQLPSVGPGNVLKDLIQSRAIATTQLTEIFRQEALSSIVTNAHRINEGEFPELWGKEDFRFVKKEDPAEAAGAVLDLACRVLPYKLGLDPVTQIQVLSPMRKGAAGVENLNLMIREKLNPPRPDRPELKFGCLSFRRGDKVMQTSNNYEKLVWNGDMGIVTYADVEEGELTVAFPEPEGDRSVTYSQQELDQLELAFCISIHKSQGSEYPAVVMPITTSHYMMLRRNLLYTGITRAKSYVAIVGTMKALGIAIRNASVAERRTWLAKRLSEGDPQ